LAGAPSADGYVAASDRSGLGITPNYELLKQYRVG
jgi:L-alanine-DL-glutamate epimerase-like enolase superfamily enzyme